MRAESVLRGASTLRPNWVRWVLGKSPDLASIRAAATPPVVELPVSDRRSHSSAAVDAYPLQDELKWLVV